MTDTSTSTTAADKKKSNSFFIQAMLTIAMPVLVVPMAWLFVMTNANNGAEQQALETKIASTISHSSAAAFAPTPATDR